MTRRVEGTCSALLFEQRTGRVLTVVQASFSMAEEIVAGSGSGAFSVIQPVAQLFPGPEKG